MKARIMRMMGASLLAGVTLFGGVAAAESSGGLMDLYGAKKKSPWALGSSGTPIKGLTDVQTADFIYEYIRKTARQQVLVEKESTTLTAMLSESLTGALEEWGFGDKTIAGSVLRFAVGEIPGGEYVTAVVNNDYSGWPAGDLFRAAVEGDMETLRDQLGRKAAQYLLGRLMRSTELHMMQAANFHDRKLFDKLGKEMKLLQGLEKYGLNGIEYAEALGQLAGGDVKSAVKSAGGVAIGQTIENEDAQNAAKAVGELAVDATANAAEKNLKAGVDTVTTGWKGVARGIAESLVGKLPQVSFVQKYARLIVTCASIGADAEAEDVYQHAFKENGWNWEICEKRIAWAVRWKTILGEDESYYKRAFESRLANEQAIPGREEELRKIIQSWVDEGLLKRGLYGFTEPPGMSRKEAMFLRLHRLGRVRQMMIDFFTIDGELCKSGKFWYMDREHFLSALIAKWYECGPTRRDEFWKWVRSQLKVSRAVEKKGDADHVWSLVKTDVEKDKIGGGSYLWTVTASEKDHACTVGYARNNRKVSFHASCTPPPKEISGGKLVKVTLSGYKTGSSLSPGSATNNVTVSCESATIGCKSLLRGPVFQGDDGAEGLYLDSEGDYWWVDEKEAEDSENRGEPFAGEFAVCMPEGKTDNERRAICFRGCGADTRWIYEWKSLKKKDDDPNRPHITATLVVPANGMNPFGTTIAGKEIRIVDDVVTFPSLKGTFEEPRSPRAKDIKPNWMKTDYSFDISSGRATKGSELPFSGTITKTWEFGPLEPQYARIYDKGKSVQQFSGTIKPYYSNGELCLDVKWQSKMTGDTYRAKTTDGKSVKVYKAGSYEPIPQKGSTFKMIRIEN